MSKATHQVVDFGPGERDEGFGIPFEGSEGECVVWMSTRNTLKPNQTPHERWRYGLQEKEACSALTALRNLVEP